jgi:DUF1680 family protein
MKLYCLVAAAVWPLVLNAQTPPQPHQEWKEQGVLYLDHSLNARQHTVPVQAVRLGDGFWSARRKVTTERSLPTLLDLLEEHGVVDKFRRLAGRPDLPRKGPLYTDSDLYKWMEGAAWALASNETSDADKQKLRGDIESLTTHILGAQEPSGYLNTYYVGDKVHLRFTELTRSHEDYCLGHLLQAGIAYYRATGSRRLLDAGIRFADYVVDNFGPAKRPFVTGHPELEMALVELYRTTGQTKYLDFARYLFSGVEKDRLKLKDADIHYMFSGKPFVSRTEFEGHAVRAIYAASGATDYFTEAGDPAYKKTLDLLWTDLTMRKMYITGGVGSRSGGESFGDPYELPSEQAYAETCAAIANVMWNFRLLALTADARYADVLERALYNGVNSGMSLSGNLYVNLYHNSELNWHLEDGTGIKIAQLTNYPWSGDVKLTLNPVHAADFTLYVRWPAWAPSAEVQVNGQTVQTASAHRGSYLAMARTWNPGDVVTLSLPMQPAPMAANPRVSDDYGRVAMQRGPLVYALEQIDQTGVALADVFVRSTSPVQTETRKDLLGGVTVLKVSGQAAERSVSEEPLYQPLSVAMTRAKRLITLTFIPYYTIGNREPTPMEVWVPLVRTEPVVSSAAVLGAEKHSEVR